MNISVKRLKMLLENVLRRLNQYDDNDKVKMVSNTYFLGDCSTFLGLSGYDGGYVNLDRIVLDEEDEEDD